MFLFYGSTTKKQKKKILLLLLAKCFTFDSALCKMADLGRRAESYSPKSSPRGSRSPVVPRQDSTGTLKTTISLGKGKTPAIWHSGPFYLMKEPPKGELTGAINLMSHYNLEHSYNKFCGRKMKDQLSAFLPYLPGNIDGPGSQDNSCLKSLIEKPPIGGKELLPLSGSQLSGFRLHPGPLPEQYRLMNQPPPKKKKHKKHKHKSNETPPAEESQLLEVPKPAAVFVPEPSIEAQHEKKHKKQKRHDDEKEKKKKKKEKKKKKMKHGPDTLGGTPIVAAPGALPHSNLPPKTL